MFLTIAVVCLLWMSLTASSCSRINNILDRYDISYKLLACIIRFKTVVLHQTELVAQSSHTPEVGVLVAVAVRRRRTGTG